MRQAGRTLTILIILLILAIIFFPWVDGCLFKQRYLDLVSAINQSRHIRVKILSYQQHWLNSQIQLQFTLINAPLQSNHKPYHWVLENQVTHGPVVIDPHFGGLRFAYAGIISKLKLPESWATIDPTKQVTILTLANFNDQWSNKIDIPALTIALPGGAINWQGLTGNFNFDVDHEMITEVTCQLNSKMITVSLNQPLPIKMIIDGFIYQSDASRKLSNLWSGMLALSLPHININTLDTSIDATQLKLNNQVAVSNNNHYSFASRLTVEQLLLPNKIINKIAPINLQLRIRDINADAANNLARYLRTMDTQSNHQEARQAYFTLFPTLFMPSTTLLHSASLNTNLGVFNGTLQISFPTDLPQPATTADLLQAANASITITAATSLVDTILADELRTESTSEFITTPVPTITSSMDAPKPVPLPILSPQSEQQMHAMMLQQLIKNWLAQGYITKVNDNYEMTLTRRRGEISINGKLLNLPMPR